MLRHLRTGSHPSVRIGALVFCLASVFAWTPAHAAENRTGAMYKLPGCECGEDYASYLRQQGYTLKLFPVLDLNEVRKRSGVPETLSSCHLFVTGRYVVDGHVPARYIDRLLREKPAIRGLSLPGKPPGSPGVAGEKRGPFTIYEIGTGAPKTFAID